MQKVAKDHMKRIQQHEQATCMEEDVKEFCATKMQVQKVQMGI